jgi:hypothetical protein
VLKEALFTMFWSGSSSRLGEMRDRPLHGGLLKFLCLIGVVDEAQINLPSCSSLPEYCEHLLCCLDFIKEGTGSEGILSY